ncbi:deoxyuridine 5'-triphosphate nucleotidohydrolase [Holotrichia oblita]|uniref:Deoxyuridine 5'-triphosphate nucleotidohydrolase n=1 Tax=Holotrichia oblita TaxID=644536 RepID=A0ACB9TRA1_HOLOL|nr:deoxyuridine 5'-triphosphate nucleotidohydrolase [Holotrichia oblita]
MKIKVINRSAFDLPRYETCHAAGLDLRADISENLVIGSLERTIVPTGLYVELPPDCEMQIRPRSGMAAKHGLTVLNSPGTIDPDYRGEIMVILANMSRDDYELKPGERIAQMVVSKFERIEWDGVDSLSDTGRGAGGFGHTGK